jgi:4-carboxymuconolactone decarboxylase
MAQKPEFETELFKRGLAVRREVLGAEYVERSMANADKFTTPILKFITEWCWGEIWSRPGLDRKTRSFINLAMLTALNRSNEVRLHMRAALRNGLTREEIGEVIMHTAIYCGAPAALDSMKAAVEVFKEIDAAA